MKKRTYKLILIFLFFPFVLNAQSNSEFVIPVSAIYSAGGVIRVMQSAETIEGGLKQLQFQTYAPFYATKQQSFVLEGKLNSTSILNDQLLHTGLGVVWKFTPQTNLAFTAGFSVGATQMDWNKTDQITVDPLLQYTRLTSYEATATAGVFFSNFWLATQYRQILNSHENMPDAYSQQYIFLTLGARYKLDAWEFRLPVYINNVMHIDAEIISVGLFASYKNNYLLVQSSLAKNNVFEIGFRPYDWLKLGLIYQLNMQTNISTMGATGSYFWQSKKMQL